MVERDKIADEIRYQYEGSLQRCREQRHPLFSCEDDDVRAARRRVACKRAARVLGLPLESVMAHALCKEPDPLPSPAQITPVEWREPYLLWETCVSCSGAGCKACEGFGGRYRRNNPSLFP